MKDVDLKATTDPPMRISDKQWEACCRQCGLCCFEKRTDRYGRHHMTREACRYLNIIERTCRVYHKRFSTGEECLKLTPEVIKEADWLPEACAYRQLLRKHPELEVYPSDASNSSSQSLEGMPQPPE